MCGRERSILRLVKIYMVLLRFCCCFFWFVVGVFRFV